MNKGTETYYTHNLWLASLLVCNLIEVIPDIRCLFPVLTDRVLYIRL